ncbi:MAG: sugar phosphate nucleotidyltransferase [Thermoanaerobaculia bacterium]
MKGMILAAGFGTRLRPITWTLPKPMVPLCNRPLIGWAVESFLRSGVREIVVNLHHLPAAIEQYLQTSFATRASFEFSVEEEILGTGGGIRRVRRLLEHDEEFYLVNADTVQFPRWAELSAARQQRDSLAALTLRHPPAGDRFTAVWLNHGLITGFGEGAGEPLMFAGSHAIGRRIFELLPDKEFSGIVDEVYRPAIAAGAETLAGVVDDGLWFDVGTPQRLLGAVDGVLEATLRAELEPADGSEVRGNSIVHATARTTGSINRSTVGSNSVVEGSVTGSAVWDDCHVPAGSLLDRCVVAHGVTIPPGIELRDAVICVDDSAIPHDDALERRDGLVIARF